MYNIKQHEEKCIKKNVPSLQSDPEILQDNEQNEQNEGYIDDAEVLRLEQLEQRVNAMIDAAKLIMKEHNIDILGGMRNAASGDCLFECILSQLLQRKCEDKGTLLFKDIIEELNIIENGEAKLRNAVIDLLDKNEIAYSFYSPIIGESTEEERREKWNQQLLTLRENNQYAMDAADLLVNGLAAVLGLDIILVLSNSAEDNSNNLSVHPPTVFGGRLTCPDPIVLIFDRIGGHYEDIRPVRTNDCIELKNLSKVLKTEGSKPKRKSMKKLFNVEKSILSQPCNEEKNTRKRDRSPSPSDDGGGLSGLPSGDHVDGGIQMQEGGADTTKPGEKNKTIQGGKTKKRYNFDLKETTSDEEKKHLKDLRNKLDELYTDIPRLRKQLKKARLGDDILVKHVTDYKDSKDGKDFQTELFKKKVGLSETKTLKLWMNQLRGKVFPFLHEKYPDIDVSILVDFTENKEHLDYLGNSTETTTKLFRFSKSDVQISVNNSFVSLTNPGPSKIQLLMAWTALCRTICYYARSNTHMFNNPMACQDLIQHYEAIALMNVNGMKRMKSETSKISTDGKIQAREQTNMNVLMGAVQKWNNSPKIKQLEKDLIDMAKSKKTPSSSQYLQYSELVQTSLVVNSPFRNQVWLALPYRAICEAFKCPGWDQTDVTGRAPNELDDIVEEGMLVKITKDISKPPSGLACEHQKAGYLLCICAKAAKPAGFNVLLSWDKSTKDKQNRFLHIPNHLWEIINAFTIVRDAYFLNLLPDTERNEGKWYQGTCPLFLNSLGKTRTTFTMSMASAQMEVEVNPHMFRKLYCTYLAHHQDPEVRKAHPRVAGHSTEVFEQFYNLNAMERAQCLMQIIVERSRVGRGATEENSVMGEESQQRVLDEEDRLAFIDAETSLVEEPIDNQSFSQPVNKLQLASLLETALKLNPDIIVGNPGIKREIQESLHVKKMTRKRWINEMVQISVNDSPEGQLVREKLLDMFRGRESPTRTM